MKTEHKPSTVFIRPMHGWWNRNPFFRAYMLRELTAFAVLAYSIALTIGVVRLVQGPQDWAEFVNAVTSPFGQAFYLVLLLSMVIHAKSWFEVMPKTMPIMFLFGKRVLASRITRVGWAVSILMTLVVLIVARSLAP